MVQGAGITEWPLVRGQRLLRTSFPARCMWHFLYFKKKQKQNDSPHPNSLPSKIQYHVSEVAQRCGGAHKTGGFIIQDPEATANTSPAHRPTIKRRLGLCRRQLAVNRQR